jgi:hypothetical protein
MTKASDNLVERLQRLRVTFCEHGVQRFLLCHRCVEDERREEDEA